MFSEEERGSSGKPVVLPQQASEEPSGHNSETSSPAGTSGTVAAETSGILVTEKHDGARQETPVPQQEQSALTGAMKETTEPAEIDSLFASMDEVSPITPGEVVRCQVLKLTENEAILDVGLKSEAAVPLSEFARQDGSVAVQAGDFIDVLVESYDEEEDRVIVSHKKAVHQRLWDEIEKAHHEKSNLKGRVVGRTKGGLDVDIGVLAFLPASQADLRPLRNLDSLTGQEITCKVAKLDRKRNNVVVSRRAALEEEFNQRRSQLLGQLAEGAILNGKVKNLVDYGAFVDLGGMDGLLHITDLSWGRVGHPSEIVRVGQELKVKVLKYAPEKDRVSLGLKQLSPDPWEQVSSAYRPGDRAMGKVVSVTDYGAFVELEPGVEGLIHVSEMTWSKRPKHPSKVVSTNDRVEVVILDVNAAQRRISLSLKQTLPDPWSTLGQRYAVGAVVQGRVRNMTDFGAFVEVEEGVDGLIHLSDLSWTKRVKHPSEVLRKGQAVEAVVLALDPEHRRLSLGLKQLQPDVWETFFSQTHVEDVLRGKVVRMAPFGAFVELQEGIEGLCHISEMDEVHGVAVGREYQFRVIRLNPQEKRIGLSLNGVDQGEVERLEASPSERLISEIPNQDGQPPAEQQSTPTQPAIEPAVESRAAPETAEVSESATASQSASVAESDG